MRVIGTAGHVDHGKSALVRALTGIDPDRLKEEKERQLTIDLGFAWITLPSGQDVSIIDVPGHEDFIKNMLAGIGGIDLALLVIAADEAVMPQTREHLAILDLLQINAGLIALTKIDLVRDPEWLELVREEVAETVRGTVLEDAPIVPVSAHTGDGIETLHDTLDALLTETPTRPDIGRPRLSVDRVFSLSGFGTIVTGTLLDGSFRVDDDVVVLPRRREARIRGMQTNKQDVETAAPGRRLAVNLSGIDTDEIRRGDVVVSAGTYQATRLVDVQLRLLPDAPLSITHDDRLELFVGAAEVMAHVRLIGVYELLPGESTFAQLRLVEPVVVAHGDRFILRQPSPSRTVGGGRVLDPTPRKRWPRFKEYTQERFNRLSSGMPADLVLQKLCDREPCYAADLLAEIHLAPEVTRNALDDLLSSGRARRLTDGSLLSSTGWDRYTTRLTELLDEYHETYPLRLGMPREELGSRLRLAPKPYAAFLAAAVDAGLVEEVDGRVRLPSHRVTLNAAQQERVVALLAQFRADPYMPPHPTEALDLVGEELLSLLIARGDLVQVSQDVLLLPEMYEEMTATVRRLIEENGGVTVAELRDHFDTSRKYAIALLEHLDDRRVTRRVGDTRVLR